MYTLSEEINNRLYGMPAKLEDNFNKFKNRDEIYGDEVKKLSQEMIVVDQYVRKLEADLADTNSLCERQIQDVDIFKKKYQEAKSEAQSAYKGLENYQVILQKFEENMQKAMESKK